MKIMITQIVMINFISDNDDYTNAHHFAEDAFDAILVNLKIPHIISSLPESKCLPNLFPIKVLLPGSM